MGWRVGLLSISARVVSRFVCDLSMCLDNVVALIMSIGGNGLETQLCQNKKASKNVMWHKAGSWRYLIQLSNQHIAVWE
jgi:hypothetical protein